MSTHYTTQTAFESLVGTGLTYPDGRQTSSVYDLLYRRTGVGESGGPSGGIAAWQFIVPVPRDWQIVEERNGSDATPKPHAWGELHR